eukprot:30999-Pelagococcus_subviridis.AAC.6
MRRPPRRRPRLRGRRPSGMRATPSRRRRARPVPSICSTRKRGASPEAHRPHARSLRRWVDADAVSSVGRDAQRTRGLAADDN